MEEMREEVESLFDDLRSPQSEDGARHVLLPCGADLAVFMNDESPDLYAEAAACDVDESGNAPLRYAKLASLNLFWRELEGFFVAKRGGVLRVEGRAALARLNDDEALNAWLLQADHAVRTVREVATAPMDPAQDLAFAPTEEDDEPVRSEV